MALDTYVNLQAAVADWLNKANLASQVPDFITIAELKLNRTVRVDQMYEDYSGQVTDVMSEFELPARTKQVLYAKLDDLADTHLHYRSPGALALLYPALSTQIPQAYTLMKSNLGGTDLTMLRVGPAPGATYDISGVVRRDFELLSAAAGNTNYWLRNAPDLLLYGSLLAATPYLKNDKRLAIWQAMYADARADLEMSVRAMENPENPTGSTPVTGMVV